MPRVKLFRIYNRDVSNDDYFSRTSYLGEGITDWEEISDDDFKFLEQNLYRTINHTFFTAVIVEDITHTIHDQIKTIKGFITKERNRILQEEQKEKDRKNRAAEKRKETALKKAKELLEKEGLLK